MKKVLFFKNTALLTATQLILRFLGIVFKVYLSGAVGSEGIGLYQLVFSVYMLANTFASSGLTVAVTRLIADELTLGSENGVKKILFKCMALAAFFAFLSGFIVFVFSKPIALFFIGDERSLPALKTLTFSLPFMAISACVRGYFTARRKALPPCISGVFEQLIRIFVTLKILKRAVGAENACTAILTGDLVAEAAATSIILLFLFADFKYLRILKGRAHPPFKLSKEIMRISLPISSSRLINSLLRTAESLLVPVCLVKFGMERSAAVSLFGMIKGMALPLIFFPSSLLSSVSSLLIPEICEAKAKGQTGIARKQIGKVLKITALSGLFLAAVFLFCGKTLCTLVYKEAEVASLVIALAPLTPLMYLDSVCDGILKGLDQQNFSFKVTVSDSALRLVFTLFFVTEFGINGFLGIMYFSNLYTCLLNCLRLQKVMGLKIKPLRNVLVPTLFAFACGYLTKSALLPFSLPQIFYAVIFCIFAFAFFFTLLLLGGITSREEIHLLLRRN